MLKKSLESWIRREARVPRLYPRYAAAKAAALFQSNELFMTVRRLLKAGEAIRGVVSMAILTELRDPRVKNVTVLGVEVAPDMREAKVIISVMGNKTQQMTTLKGLQNSAGFLQSKIADRIDTRYTPRLTFVLDDGIKKSIAVNQILEQIAAERDGKDLPTDGEISDSEIGSEATSETAESKTIDSGNDAMTSAESADGTDSQDKPSADVK